MSEYVCSFQKYFYNKKPYVLAKLFLQYTQDLWSKIISDVFLFLNYYFFIGAKQEKSVWCVGRLYITKQDNDPRPCLNTDF